MWSIRRMAFSREEDRRYSAHPRMIRLVVRQGIGHWNACLHLEYLGLRHNFVRTQHVRSRRLLDDDGVLFTI
jgi:hypothetical protein